MRYIYYVSFVYLDRHGKERFDSVEYPFSRTIKTENDINQIAEILRMHYSTKHLRVLAFSPLKVSTSLEQLKEIFQQFAVEIFSGKRWRQKLKTQRLSKQRRR